VDEERGHPHGREPVGECAPLEVFLDRCRRLLGALDAVSAEIVGPRDARICEVVRPEQVVGLERRALPLRDAQVGVFAACVEVLDPRPVPRCHPCPEVPSEFVERLALGAERVDADDPEEPLGMRDREVEGKLAAPRVSDHPCPLDPVPAEYSERVRGVDFYRVGWAGVGGLDPSLRVSGRRHERREFGCEGLRVVGDAGTAVE
jgi:hypothetical protein